MQLLYETDFSENRTKDGWSFHGKGKCQFVSLGSKKALKIEYSDSKTAYSSASYTISNLNHYSGYDILFYVDIKAENVSIPEQSYNGIKFTFVYSENGNKKYPQNCPSNHGTFEWTRTNFFVTIPKDVSETGLLCFGLSQSTGTIYFSDLRIEYGYVYLRPSLSPSFKCEYSSRVLSKPPMRGVMSPQSYRENDLSDLRKWNANLIRWQIDGGNNEPDFLSWLDKKIEQLDLALSENEEKELGINFIIDLHSVPGGRNFRNEFMLSFNEDFAQIYFKAWEKIANHYKENKSVWAYDLINEPIQFQVPNENRDCLSIQFEAAKIIRNVDAHKPIIIESQEWNLSLSPLPLPDIIYEIHMYQPLSYTHQNVFNKKYSDEKEIKYPGLIDGKNYDINELELILMPTIEFQQKYGCRIYLGEFSAVRWAPGADVYIEDVIRIAEKYSWDWTYHAYREFHGWSVEHVEDNKRIEIAKYTTKRKAVLLKYFQKNKFI